MTARASRGRWALLGLTALLLAPPIMGLQTVSAAHLDVTAAPLQTWVLTELQLPAVQYLPEDAGEALGASPTPPPLVIPAS